MKKPHATLEGAIRIARAIENILIDHGAHCALTGGCLYNGESYKDVDIMIYPHKVAKGYDRNVILRALRDSGAIECTQPCSRRPANQSWETTTCCTNTYLDKDVEIVTWNRADLAGTRVDLIFV